MFVYYKHNQIDLVKWDECINNSRNGIVYALSWYLNLASPGWDAIIKEESGKYLAVMPVTHSKKFNLPYLRQPDFSQQLGLFFTIEVSDKDFLQITGILKERFNQITYYGFNVDNTQYLNNLEDFSIKQGVNFEIDLSDKYVTIANNYFPYRKIDIRRGSRSDLTLKNAFEVDTVIALFKENVAYKIYGGVKEHQYKLLRNIFLKASQNNNALVISAFNASGKVVSSSFFLTNSNRVIYLFNATNFEGKKKNAAALIIDEVIKRYSETPRIFDFEGSDIPSLAKFYESFGSKPKVFYSISYSKLPLIIKIAKGLRMKFSRLMAGIMDKN